MTTSMGELKIAAARRPAAAAYWRERLAGGPSGNRFPTDHTSGTGPAEVRVALPTSLAAALDRLTRGNDRALHVTLLAGLVALVRAYTGADEVSIGHPAPPETGPLGELSVLRCPIAATDTLRELLPRMRELVVDADRHADFPLAVLAEELGFAPGTPLVDLACEFRDRHKPDATAGVPTVVSFDRADGGAEDGQLRLRIRYPAERYLPDSVQRIAGHFLRLLGLAVAEPDRPLVELSLFTALDAESLTAMNDTAAPFDSAARLPDVFERQAAATPDALAVSGPDSRLSYAELDRRANRLAWTLREHGVGRDELVAVLAERSPDLIVGILAVLKAGGAYLPLDPGHPAARTEYVLSDSGARLVLATPGLTGAVSGVPVLDLRDEHTYARRTDPPPRPGDSGDLAYVIYTSGSTGRPKGVAVEHRSVVNRIAWMQKAYPITERDVLVQKTPVAFDVSVWELFWWMFTGGSLRLLPPGGERDPETIVAAVAEHGVTTMHFVPSMLTVFLEYVAARRLRPRLAGLRQVFASGEALPAHTVRRFHEQLPGVELINLYGPTEATVDVSHHRCVDDRVLIGRPIDNLALYVVDERLRPVPPGVPGELCIAGVGLARGYLHRPELTEEKFVAAPFDGVDRLYRTGDLARWLPDGTVDYLGRIDHQVKIRGYRIELGEIEQRLREHPSVGDAVVLARDAVDGDRYLCAYLVPAVDGAVDVAGLRAHLAATLPEYMVPAHSVLLDRFPLSPNGKLDRRALPEPVRGAARPTGYLAPRDEREAALAGIWADVLGLERVGVLDNFFALGGNSIHFVSVLARARALGISATFAQLFEHPTVADLLANAGQAPDAEERQEFAPFELVSEADRALLPEDVTDAYPLALLQAGLIYQSELTKGTAQYHDVMSYLIASRFEREPFERAVRILVRQNAMLRTTYHLTEFSEPLQLVRADVPPPLRVVDLRGMSEQAQQDWHDDWVARTQARRFRWDRPGLIKLHVQVLSDDRYRYSIELHNSTLDGWSINLVHTKLFDIYARLRDGREPVEPDDRDHMRNFVGLERRSLASAEDRRYWSDVLTGVPPIEVPGRLPAGAADYQVRMHDVRIEAELSDRILLLADQLAVPVKNVLLAAHVRALAELSGRSEVLTGYEHAGRPELEGAQDAIGMFLNTVPFRVRLGGGTWADLIRQVHRTEIDLLPRRRYPMARMKQDVGVRGTLFESVFNFTHFYPLRKLRQGADFTLLDVRAWAETEFVLRAEFSRHFFTDQVCLYLQYHADVFDETRVAEIGAAYRGALEAMTADPSAPHSTAAGAMAVALPAAPAGVDPGAGRSVPLDAVAEHGELRDRIASAWAEVLGLPVGTIRAEDDFFDLGGHSLSALRATVRLGGLVTLTDLAAHPVLGELAAVAASRSGDASGLLRRLSPPAAGAAGTLVCFPYAGGNAVNYRALAQRLDPSVAVLAVELPGHDAGLDEPFVDIREAAARVVAELAGVTEPVVLWGHCGGASVAVEVAALLEAAGRGPRHVVLAAKLLPTVEEMTGALAELDRSTDADVIRWMVGESGYAGLDGLEPAEVGTLARSFRHDVDGGHRYFLDLCADPDRYRLAAPITVVAAKDDPLTVEYPTAHRRWGLITEDLRLREFDGGGHYFISTNAPAAAALVAELFAAEYPVAVGEPSTSLSGKGGE